MRGRVPQAIAGLAGAAALIAVAAGTSPADGAGAGEPSAWTPGARIWVPEPLLKRPERIPPLEAARHLSGGIGSRPAGSRSERTAHRYALDSFREQGLPVRVRRFGVPGGGRSRNVIARYEGARDCLVVLMAHIDSVPPGRGANDNASGVGVLIGTASRIQRLGSRCDLWLVATGAEERVVIGTGYHVGAAALVKEVRRAGRARDLRFALSVDMVGRGKRFYLRSPRSRPRPGVEQAIVAAARRAGVTVRWAPDSGKGNSDHREFELAGLPAAVLEAWRGHDPCHHAACDRPGRLQKGALLRVERVLVELVAKRPRRP